MYHKDTIKTPEKLELRKIQAIHGQTTFVLVIPKDFIERLSFTKGDYVKCTIAGDSLVVKKADI
jgi:hypothetical protein